ncbi:hypothetical protein [Mucilaginibacter terrae]|uniref:hypothetical protein n=1 Tax=Mucilaginibacter terrae TaxID=1955052 RepID=UPI00289A4167|nr:hypothetical protein [Mucilaginibacter terrae]
MDADLKRAKHILRNEHGIWLSKEDELYTLNVLEPYAKTDLTKFKFSSRKEGKYIVGCWKHRGKKKLEIYQVETTLHVDSVFETANYTDLTGKRTVEHTHIVTEFRYRTYIINDSKKPQLIFTIATKGEQLNYSIGKHTVYPMYESIPVGLLTPDEKTILKVIAKN